VRAISNTIGVFVAIYRSRKKGGGHRNGAKADHIHDVDILTGGTLVVAAMFFTHWIATLGCRVRSRGIAGVGLLLMLPG